MVPQSVTMDGIVWANERCGGRGCLYETAFRLVVAPRRPRLLNLLGATAPVEPDPAPTPRWRKRQ